MDPLHSFLDYGVSAGTIWRGRGSWLGLKILCPSGA
jgi:hypothetical protein